MKTLLTVIFIMTITMVATDEYTNRFDSLNIDDVIANRRLLTAYVKCIMDKGRCTPEGKELKSHITEALQTGCAKCTDKQRHNIKRVIKHLVNNEKDSWNQLVDMYDPHRNYSHKYEKELKSI